MVGDQRWLARHESANLVKLTKLISTFNRTVIIEHCVSY